MENLPKDFFLQNTRFTKDTFQDVYPSIDPTKPELSVAGKVVVVTGASRGIGGRGIAPAFAKAGAKALVLLATNAKRLEVVAAQLRGINPDVDILTSTAGLTDRIAIESLFAEIQKRWGHADVLVNNAAVNAGPEDLHVVDPDAWWSNYEIDVKGPFLLMRSFLAALPDPKATPATIVNINSKAAFTVIPGMHGYSTAKLALLQLGAHMAAMYPTVNVVAVNPGFVDTDALLDMFRSFDLETPELTGGVCVWLAADPERARFLSGRFITSNWSVDELVHRKDEIVGEGKLMINLVATFGKEQFGE